MNVYQPPEQDQLPSQELDNKQRAEEVRKGQKFLIYSVMCYLALIPFNIFSKFAGGEEGGILVALIGLLAIPILVALVVLGIVGIIKAGAGLKINLVVRILLCILLFVPIVGLLMLVFLNSRATKFLKDSGYRVGFFGAK